MSLLTPDTGLLFWMTIAFGVVLFILARYGFPVITRAVEKRSDYIAESLRKADEARAQLAEVAQRAEQMLEKARTERGDILADAQQARKDMLAEARMKAEEDARRRMERAESEARELRQRTMDEVRDEVVDLSIRIAEKVIGEKLDDEQRQRMLIERYLKEEEVRKS
jgi:ATP synthase, F0 subunit b